MSLLFKYILYDFGLMSTAASFSKAQSGSPIFFIGNNATNVGFQVVRRLWFIGVELFFLFSKDIFYQKLMFNFMKNKFITYNSGKIEKKLL